MKIGRIKRLASLYYDMAEAESCPKAKKRLTDTAEALDELAAIKSAKKKS